MTKNRNLYIKLVFGVFFALLSPTTLLITRATTTASSPGGTYSDWYFPSTGYQSLEWTFVPIKDPPESMATANNIEYYGALHYYAYTFGLVNSTAAIGRGYAGFQSNGLFHAQPQGKVINYSIWGSNGGKSPEGLVNPTNDESGGFQIMMKYDWQLNHDHYFQLKQGPSGSDAQGTWWGLWVTDQQTSVSKYIGEQRVQGMIGGLPSTTWEGHTSMFAEDTHWWYSLNGTKTYQCSDFPNSAMAAINITANRSVPPSKLMTSTTSGVLTTGDNGTKTISCKSTVYVDNKNVQHNIGYWKIPANNNLAALASHTTSSFETPVPEEQVRLPDLTQDQPKQSKNPLESTGRQNVMVKIAAVIVIFTTALTVFFRRHQKIAVSKRMLITSRVPLSISVHPNPTSNQPVATDNNPDNLIPPGSGKH